MSGSILAIRRRYKASSILPPAQSPAEDSNEGEDSDSSSGSEPLTYHVPVTGTADLIALVLELGVYIFSGVVFSHVRPSRVGDGGSFSVSQFSLHQEDGLEISIEQRNRDRTARHGHALKWGDKIAIKHVNAAVSEQKQGDDRSVLLPMIREIRVLAHPPLRDHPNIVNLIGIAWEPKTDFSGRAWPCLVLEYAGCGDLEAFFSLPGIDFTWGVKEKLAGHVFGGLMALHLAGVVHGDLKAENVLVTVDEAGGFVAKLSDFGFALISTDWVGFPPSADIALVGYTPHWAAPEIHKGPVRWDGMLLADIYSFGLILAFILAGGIHPFSDLADGNPDPKHRRLLSAHRIHELQSAGLAWDQAFANILQGGHLAVPQQESIKSILKGALATSPNKRRRALEAFKRVFAPESDWSILSSSTDMLEMSDEEEFSDEQDFSDEELDDEDMDLNEDVIMDGSSASSTSPSAPISPLFTHNRGLSLDPYELLGETEELATFPYEARVELHTDLKQRFEGSKVYWLDGKRRVEEPNADAGYALAIIESVGLGEVYDTAAMLRYLANAAIAGSLVARRNILRVLAAQRPVQVTLPIEIEEHSEAWVESSIVNEFRDDHFVLDTLEQRNPTKFVAALARHRQEILIHRSLEFLDPALEDALIDFWSEFDEYAGNDFTETGRTVTFFRTVGTDPQALLGFVRHVLSKPNPRIAVVFAGAAASGINLLHLSTYFGNLDLVKEVLASPAYRGMINAPDSQGCTPLLYSCIRGDSVIVNYLLDRGADPRIGHDGHGNTCLHFLRFFKRETIPSIVERFEKARCDFNAANSQSLTPLHAAVGFPLSSMTMLVATEELLARGADPALRTQNGKTPLTWAVVHLQPEILQSFLGRIALAPRELTSLRVSLVEELCVVTPLDMMAYGGARYGESLARIVGLLLDRDTYRAFKALEGGQGTSPLFFALFYGAIGVASALIDCCPCVDVNEPDNRGRPALRWAIRHRRRANIRWLASCPGINLLYEDDDGENAFHAAAEYDPDILTFLFEATGTADNEKVRKLLNSRNQGGLTPLGKAVLHGHLEAARLLASRGARYYPGEVKINVTWDGSCSRTPSTPTTTGTAATLLETLLSNPTTSHDQVALLLGLADGAEPLTSADGSTVFHWISGTDAFYMNEDPTSFELDSKLKILELMLSKCITLLPNVNSRGQTALHAACWAVRSDVVSRLLEVGLSPHDRDKESRTPLDILQLRKQATMFNQVYPIVREALLEEMVKTERRLVQAAETKV